MAWAKTILEDGVGAKILQYILHFVDTVVG